MPLCGLLPYTVGTMPFPGFNDGGVIEAVAVTADLGVPTEWYGDPYEGELSVDVYQTETELVVVSTVAGVKPDELEVTLNRDVVTIRGRRDRTHEVPKEDYFYQECYWGAFSRSIVLPVEVQPAGVHASLKNGVLTVVLPKAAPAPAVSVPVTPEGY